MLYHNCKCTHNDLIIHKIINKIERGLFENKKNLEKSLTKNLKKELKYYRDGRGMDIDDIDLAFEGMEVVKKIVDILKNIEKKGLKKAFSFHANDTIQQQFFSDLVNLNDLELHKIGNVRDLFGGIDDLFNCMSKKQIL